MKNVLIVLLMLTITGCAAVYDAFNPWTTEEWIAWEDGSGGGTGPSVFEDPDGFNFD